MKKTVLITGASQGIGLAIALRFAEGGYNIVIATKDSESNIEQAAKQITALGAKVLPLSVDVSDQHAIKNAIASAVEKFSGIDVLVNNTSATCFTDTLHTTPEQFDLVMSTSVRAAFLFAQACFSYLKEAQNPHIINISPPLNLDANWFKDHLAFSMAKYAMSMCTLGMSVEFYDAGIAVNSLWPQTTIATQTIKKHFLTEVYTSSRWPSIMGDAAYELASRTLREWTGQFFTDEALLRKAGIDDFSHYAVDPSVPLMQPLFIPLQSRMAPISRELFLANKQFMP
ncbi:MAG: SDR family oxidoreductase [Pseudomonadota bacterium]|nr:SDR family oxidoreductase [Pseudomonadota bacterium]